MDEVADEHFVGHRRVEDDDGSADGGQSVIFAGLVGVLVVIDVLKDQKSVLEVVFHLVGAFLDNLGEAVGDVAVEIGIVEFREGSQSLEELRVMGREERWHILEGLGQAAYHLHVVIDILSFLQELGHIR